METSKIASFKSILKNYGDIFLILVVGTFLRIKEIGKYEFWFDEAYTGILVRQPLSSFAELVTQDPTPPLYYSTAKFWTLIFGTSDVAIRSFSLLFGVLTIFFAYLLIKKLVNKEAAAFGALIIAVSPFFVEYSVEARTYSLYGFLVLAATYFLVSKKYNTFSVFLVLMIFSHYVAIFYGLILAGYYLYNSYKTNKDNIVKASLRVVPFFVLLFLAIYLANNSQGAANFGWVNLPSVLSIPDSVSGYMYGILVKLPGNAEINTLNMPYIGEITARYFGWIFFIAYFVGLAFLILKNKHKITKKHELVLINLLTLVPILIIIVLAYTTKYNLYVERYMYPSALFFVVSFSYVLSKILGFEIIVILMLFYILSLVKVLPPNYYTGMKTIANTYQTSNRTVVFTSPMDYVVARFYFGENNIGIKLHDPQQPEEDFAWWPMVRQGAHIKNLDDVVVINPDPGRFDNTQGDFLQIGSYGSYGAYLWKR